MPAQRCGPPPAPPAPHLHCTVEAGSLLPAGSVHPYTEAGRLLSHALLSLPVSNKLYTDNIAFIWKNSHMRLSRNIPNHRFLKTFYISIGHCQLPQTRLHFSTQKSKTHISTIKLRLNLHNLYYHDRAQLYNQPCAIHRALWISLSLRRNSPNTRKPIQSCACPEPTTFQWLLIFGQFSPSHYLFPLLPSFQCCSLKTCDAMRSVYSWEMLSCSTHIRVDRPSKPIPAPEGMLKRKKK